MTAYATYASAPAHKLLSDNRERYIAQSAATRNGKVPPLPLRIVHGDQPDGAHIADSPLAGRHSDPPAFDDFMDADGRQLDYASVSRGW